MHAKFRRRIRGAPPPNRAPRDQNGDSGEDDGDGDDGLAFPLPDPITITVVQTVSRPQSTLTPVFAPAATSTSSSATPNPTSSPPPPQPPQTATTPVATPSTTSSWPTPSSNYDKTPPRTTSSTRLSSGGIAGIVIMILILSSIVLVFALRRRFRHNRMKLRSMWTQSRGVALPADVDGPGSFETEGYRGMQALPSFGSALAGTQGIRVSSANTSKTPRSALLSFTTVSPVYSPDFALSSPVSVTVVSSFVTALPDELSISVGETIRVMAEYDDGWSLCINARGEQGMVPQECLKQGAPSIRSLLLPPPDFDARSTKRTSSLDPRRTDKD